LCLIDLGTVYSYENLHEEAAVRLGEGIVLQKQAIGEQHPYTAHTLRILCDVYRRQGKLEAAEASLGEAFSIMLSRTRLQNRQMAPFLIASAQLSASAGRYEESRKTYEMARQMLLTTYGPDHLYTAQAMQGAAETALACGNLQDAREQIKQSMELQERYFGDAADADRRVAGSGEDRAGVRCAGRSEASMHKAIAAAKQGNNVVTLARVYEQVGAIRAEGMFTAAFSPHNT
jgi:tetratricopeptide (TPR) repeat protein